MTLAEKLNSLTWGGPGYEPYEVRLDRSAQARAKQAFGQAEDTANTGSMNAAGERAALVPGLEREAASPQGYTPQEMNDMLVAGEQGAGGATAGITGQADLQAARTRNTAGYTAALDEAARNKTRALSENALGVKQRSADLGQQKQMFAQKALQGLYGTDIGESLSAQGLETEDINAEAKAGQSGWFQNMLGMINALKPGYGGGKVSFGG